MLHGMVLVEIPVVDRTVGRRAPGAAELCGRGPRRFGYRRSRGQELAEQVGPEPRPAQERLVLWWRRRRAFTAQRPSDAGAARTDRRGSAAPLSHPNPDARSEPLTVHRRDGRARCPGGYHRNVGGVVGENDQHRSLVDTCASTAPVDRILGRAGCSPPGYGLPPPCPAAGNAVAAFWTPHHVTVNRIPRFATLLAPVQPGAPRWGRRPGRRVLAPRRHRCGGRGDPAGTRWRPRRNAGALEDAAPERRPGGGERGRGRPQGAGFRRGLWPGPVRGPARAGRWLWWWRWWWSSVAS